MKSTPHKLVGINDEELVALYESDKGAVRLLAERFSVSVNAIYYRLKKLGIKRRSNSEAHGGQMAWNKGNGYIDPMGYRVIHVNGKQVREHRHVMEQHLGRKLVKGEVVHHINSNRADNRIENLELHASHSEHMKQHMTTEAARKRGAKGLSKILENRRRKALKAVGYGA